MGGGGKNTGRRGYLVRCRVKQQTVWRGPARWNRCDYRQVMLRMLSSRGTYPDAAHIQPGWLLVVVVRRSCSHPLTWATRR